MTPADIQKKRFDKGINGYRAEEVNQYLAQVADYVAGLEQHNGELQEKMEILADKLEQYREDEDSLRAALIGAQKLGQSVVREAHRKAEAIVAEAVRKAEGIVTEAQTNIDREVVGLGKLRQDVSEFRDQIIQLYNQQLSEMPNFQEQLVQLYNQQLEVVKCLPSDDYFKTIEIPKIKYEPPAVEYSEEVEADHPAGGDEKTEAPSLTVVGAAPAKNAGAAPKSKGYEKIAEYFGENNTIERK